MQKILKFFGSFEEFDEKKVFLTAFWISVVVMLLHIFFFHKVERDSAYLYTAMAREFGAGRYQFAFYPAIPPLLSVLAGCLCKIGFPSFGAVKTIAAIFFIIGLFPFRALMIRATNAKLAAWACIVYVCSSYMIRYSVYGYPFALKMFFLILSTYLVVKFAETLKLRYSFYLGFSLGLLALARGECIIFFPFYVMWFIVLPLYFVMRSDKIKRSFKALLLNQILGLFLIVLGTLAVCWPQMIYVYNRTGIPITELRTGEIIKKNIIHYFPELKQKKAIDKKKTIVPIMEIKSGSSSGKTKDKVRKSSVKSFKAPSFSDKSYRPPEKSYDVQSFARSLKESYKGLYPILIIFAFIGLFFKFKNKKFNSYDLFFLSVILYNALMFLATIAVTRRYTAVTQPFEFGWVALGGYYIYSWGKWKILPDILKKQWKRIIGLASIILLVVLLINGLNRFTKYIFEGNQYYTVGEWIKHNKKLFPGDRYVKVNNFYTDRLPVVFCIISEYGFWGEFDYVGIDTNYTYSYKDIIKNMKSHNATVLIYDDRIKEVCPSFMKNNWRHDFIQVKEFPKWKITIFRLKNPYSS